MAEADPFNFDKVLLLDGGLSNELNNRVSYDVHEAPVWTAKALVFDPDAVISTHVGYLEAGADIIETASYQATLEGFKDFLSLSPEDTKSYLQKSVELAKTAVRQFTNSDSFAKSGRRFPLVAGSLGPYGVYLCNGSEYSGEYMKSVTRGQIEDMHLPRIKALVENGADLLAIETQPSLQEVQIILDLLKTHFPNTKAWVSFATNESDPTLTAYGDSMEDAYSKVREYPQVIAIGINCCKPSNVEVFLRHIRSFELKQKEGARVLKKLVYPNSGQTWIPGKGWISPPMPTADEYLGTWLSLGVDVVGGCCQVGIPQVKKMRTILDDWNDK